MTLIFVVLVAASLLSSIALPIAGRQVRLEHLAAPIASAALLGLYRFSSDTIRINAYVVLATAWVLVNALSSWLFAVDPSESFVHVLRLGLLALTFLTVANLRPFNAPAWGARVRIWLVLGCVELAYGAFTWGAARFAGLWLPGAWIEPSIAGISIKGTQFERNLFGILAATLLTVATYLWFARRRDGKAWPTISSGGLKAICALAAVAVVVSLTRSAWIAVAGAAPAAYLLFERRPFASADRALLHTAAAAPLALAVLIAAVHLLPAPAVVDAPRRGLSQGAVSRAGSTNPPSNAVAQRLSTFGTLGADFTLNTRIQDAVWALDDWRRRPVFGHGTNSFVQLHGIRAGTEAWVSNLILHTLVDTGVVGLAIQWSLFGLIAARAWRVSRTAASPEIASGLKALTLGLLVTLIAYQLTDGTWLAVFWIHLGLLVNGLYVASSADSSIRLESAASHRLDGEERRTRVASLP